MYRVLPEPMPGNPAAKGPGNFGGMWQVNVYEKVMGKGNVFQFVAADNLPYEEATDKAYKLERKLNGVE